ncbi:carbohydrate ABC transporter permease [Hoyosella altamirensis]|uniref:Raffinose/stachyose/melibiose transport system permease protein n=1 Tax=Hoyosella altamirensis TaxID=616997 RepID=A0A839RR76_9ACTN|nr:carbohydrate ABC transporter permease [Hoyosella altamirensis]MBB3039472.1 raffinose/stachyose/melibiose transport system permease protein [Hoyosella altamirensis]
MSTTLATHAPAEPQPRRKRRRTANRVSWPITLLMLAASLTILIPLYFTIAMALKTPRQAITGSGFELPSPIALDNFSRAWETVDFGRALMVTSLVTVTTVLGAIIVSSMVAYAIIRNWEHRLFRYSFIYLLAGLFIPFTVVILPLIKQTSVLGLDNPAGVALIHIVGGIAFNTLLFCAFLRSIPTELEESARIDGASTWQVFWQVVFPLLGPMSATVGIFAFLNSWNDFILPQMLIANPSLQTLPVVQHIFQGEFNIEYNLAFASYLMALGPTLIAFIIAQRWVLSGVMRGAIK